MSLVPASIRDRGSYLLAGLFPGTYDLKVELSGFKTYERTSVTLSPNDNRGIDVRLELGLQESVTTAVKSGYGVTFISSTSVESDLGAGTLAAARVEGLELGRDIFLVRATGRAESRAAHAFVQFARERMA